MTDLSPSAQMVLDAYINAPCGKPRSTWVAAALRAAVNIGDIYNYSSADIIDNILVIADELEAH